MKSEEIIEATKDLLPSERLEVVRKVLISIIDTVGKPKGVISEQITEDWRYNSQYITAALYNMHGLVDFVYSHIREKLLFL